MSNIIDTKTIPHYKFRIPLPWNPTHPKKVTYYVGCIKEGGLRDYGKFQIHENIDGDGDGYGGANLTFLMADGTIEIVKGPFYKAESLTPRILFEILQALQEKGS